MRLRLLLCSACLFACVVLSTTAHGAQLPLPSSSVKTGAANAQAVSSEPIVDGLFCSSIHLSQDEVKLPVFDDECTLTLSNSSPQQISLTKASLLFFAKSTNSNADDKDITRNIYVEARADNPVTVPPDRTVNLDFRVELLHDVPIGKINVLPNVLWMTSSPNASVPESTTAPRILNRVGLVPIANIPTSGNIGVILRVVDAGVAPTSPVVFLGDDRPSPGTNGNWIGRYGNASFILCGLQSPEDVVGGEFLPVEHWSGGRPGVVPTSPAWSGWQGTFAYDVCTGEGQEARHWMDPHEGSTDDERAFINPLEGGRRFPSWDDEGEQRSADEPGPDLLVHLLVPPGIWRLTYNFIDWDHYADPQPRVLRLLLYDTSHVGVPDDVPGAVDANDQNLVSSGFASDLGQGLYKVYAVHGPANLTLRIEKVHSINAVLSGIFLDRIQLADVNNTDPPPFAEQDAALKSVVSLYNKMRKDSQLYPNNFIRSSQQMAELDELAAHIVENTDHEVPSPREAADARVATWVVWQCNSALLVNPVLKEESFESYLKLHPSLTYSDALFRLRILLSQGEIGDARLATTPLLILARQSGLTVQNDCYRELIMWFSKRDTNFACKLADSFAATIKDEDCGPACISALASDIGRAADMDLAGPLHNSAAYRVTSACYEAISRNFGDRALGDADAFKLAQAIEAAPSYHDSNYLSGVTAYQNYLATWPSGAFANEADSNIVQFVANIMQDNVASPADYKPIAEAAANRLAANVPNATSGSPTNEEDADALALRVRAINAARSMAYISHLLHDTASEKKWHASEAELTAR